ncbi:MAG TPA: hypothetical protein VIS71_09060 [Terrimicrobium sp.]
MRQLADNLWIKSYPLPVLGTNHGRTVTLLRLRSGRLVVHSMAPFSSAEVDEVRGLGQPGWLVEAMLLHDTYARHGRDAFPEVPFLAPPGFGEAVRFPTFSLLPAPGEWAGEIEVIELAGAPRLKEYAFVHVPTRSLIVADLIFNFSPHERGWERFFHRYIAGFKRYPGMSRIFRFFIKDRAAFRASIGKIMAADFDRIIVGHGNVIEKDGKRLLRQALADAAMQTGG